jgi:hypothetical protein
MTLIPDRKPLECNTRAVPNINSSAIFNEKFTFEINNDDLHKRLCFSIYNYQQEKNDMQLQGCLSFGIKNTLKKQRVKPSEELNFMKNKFSSIRFVVGFIFYKKMWENYDINKYRIMVKNM